MAKAQGGSRPPVRATADDLWEDIRDELRRNTPDFKFHIWLEPLELAGVRGRTLYVRAPDHIRTSVTERYLPLLRHAAAARFDAGAVVEIVDEAWIPGEEGSAARGTEQPSSRGLNPRFTFEQFVIGAGNRFAHAAALAVAELPAQAYNPLFLFGRPGLGKTHLLHAIANYVDRYGPGLSVHYSTIEDFTSEFVEAVRGRSTARFKERFRGTDVVLIDDVQFLAGREKTREEFFHTFNALLESGRQLVMTSDRCPEEIPQLEARLAERFRAGLVVELDPPTLAVRRTILAIRARMDEVDVSEEVLDEIAAQVTTSVRALEGALIRVVAYSSLKNQLPTPELVRHVLARLATRTVDAKQHAQIDDIVLATAQEFGVEPQTLIARDRRADATRARHVAMYVARELVGKSLPEIGRGMGGRNHATVLHAVKRVQAALPGDEGMQAAVDNLNQRFGGPSTGRPY
jgi:chromosomal replication initiator protein